MKSVILPILLLAGLPALAQMQPPVPTEKEMQASGAEAGQPFRKANVILTTTTDSAKVALRKVAGIMQQKGFALDRVDYDLLSISTKPHAFSGSIYTMTVLVVWDAGQLKFRGQWQAQAMGMQVDEAIAYTNPASKKAFTELQALAAAYPGGKVSYALRP